MMTAVDKERKVAREVTLEQLRTLRDSILLTIHESRERLERVDAEIAELHAEALADVDELDKAAK